MKIEIILHRNIFLGQKRNIRKIGSGKYQTMFTKRVIGWLYRLKVRKKVLFRGKLYVIQNSRGCLSIMS